MSSSSCLSQVLTSIDVARGLPNQHYIETEAYNEEKTSVLFSNWSGIGFGKDVPETGDARPIDFLGMPLLIVRGNDEKVRVFQNTCRHRGMILVDEPKKIKGPIRCPYHSWAYSLEGDLRATPYVGGAGKNTHPCIKNEDLGLIEIRSYVWRDVIFVNVDGKAPAFEEVHAELIERWREHDQPIFHGGETSSFKLNVKTNWKLAVENYCESYHLPWVHPELNRISRLDDHYNIESLGNYSGQGTLVYSQLEDEDGNRLPDFAGLSEKWDRGAEYIAMYPNVLFGVARDHSFAIVLEPIDMETTVEHVELYYATDYSDTGELDKLLAANARLWRNVFEEDVYSVEGMQRGRKGEFFDGGIFSPAMDGPTYVFHHWVADQLQKGRDR